MVPLSALVSTLQIINSLWDNHNIEEEHEKIKEYAEKILEDFSNFLKNYITLKKHLNDAIDVYQNSINIVGEDNKSGIIYTAQQLANIIPTIDISKSAKNIIKQTGFDGSKKI